MVDLYKYRAYVPNLNGFYEVWGEDAPTAISGHPVDPDSISVVETSLQSRIEAKIVEEEVKTGGRFQCRNVVIDVTQSGLNEVNVSWPIPINLLSAEFVIEDDHIGDRIECVGGPNTVIGTLSSSVLTSGTELQVASPVFSALTPGMYVGFTADLINFTELGVITATSGDTSTIYISEELPLPLPSGTPIYAEAKFVTDFQLYNKTRHTIGDTKVGASYLDVGKVLRFKYFNDSGVINKKFSIMLEYLY